MKNITTQEITCVDERAAHGRVRWQKQNRGHDAASAGAGRCPQPSAGPASAQPGGRGAGLPKGEGHRQERLPFAQGALVPGWEKGARGLAEAASRAGGVLGSACAGRWVSKLLPRASGRGSVPPLLARSDRKPKGSKSVEGTSSPFSGETVLDFLLASKRAQDEGCCLKPQACSLPSARPPFLGGSAGDRGHLPEPHALSTRRTARGPGLALPRRSREAAQRDVRPGCLSSHHLLTVLCVCCAKTCPSAGDRGHV